MKTMQFSIILLIIATLATVIVVTWLLSDHKIDKLKHPEEWKDAGMAGERIIYLTLRQKFNIPENQIFRNVYIPKEDGTTSEIDLLILSKKGLFVVECKNYGGSIYGNAKRKKWVQYIGKEKNRFYSPLLQNKNHAKYLKQFLAKNNIEVPIVPLISTISRGNWRIKNLNSDDYILGTNCHLEDIYAKMPDSKNIAKNFETLIDILTSLSRPDESIKEEHIEEVAKKARQAKRTRRWTYARRSQPSTASERNHDITPNTPNSCYTKAKEFYGTKEE